MVVFDTLAVAVAWEFMNWYSMSWYVLIQAYFLHVVVALSK